MRKQSDSNVMKPRQFKDASFEEKKDLNSSLQMKQNLNDISFNSVASSDKSHIMKNIHNRINFQELSVDVGKEANIQRWQEVRFLGDLPERRSYHASIVFDNKYYVYGGYDIKAGDLGTFYCVDLTQEECQWKELEIKGKHPETICRHTAVEHAGKMWVLGGESKYNPTKAFFSVDLKTLACAEPRKNPSSEEAPIEIDSHTASVNVDPHHPDNASMVVFGGYLKSQKTNRIFDYNFATNQWRELVKKSATAPAERCNHTAVCYKDALYVFGGINNENEKLGDFWKFDLKTHQWEDLTKSGVKSRPPIARSGHDANLVGDRMYVFGGIQSMTHEMNDLHFYDFLAKEWCVVHHTCQIDDPIAKNSPLALLKESKMISDLKKKDFSINPHNMMDLSNSMMSSSKSPIRTDNRSNSVSPSPTKVKIGTKTDANASFFSSASTMSKKKKQKKQLANDNYEDIQQETPLTLALKNSICFRVDPTGGTRKKKHQMYEGPKQPTCGKVIACPPCPRDGSSVSVWKDKLIVFGGDRYQMAFNDLHLYNIGDSFKCSR